VRAAPAQELRGERGRGHARRQHAQACAAPRARRLEHRHELGQARVERRDAPVPDHDAAAVGIVELEDPGLRERVGRPEAGRMLGVALDLGRTPEMALDQEPERPARPGHGRREVQRLARYDVLGVARERMDALGRLPRARAEPGEAERAAHEPQEITPPHGIVEQERVDARRERPEPPGPLGPPMLGGRAAEKLLQAAPGAVRAVRAHRWHVAQLSRVSMW
jgi:hypothetical protein